MIRTFFFFLIICISFLASKAQDLSYFISMEDSLDKIARNILYGENDLVKYNASEQFTELLVETLSESKSIKYPFDSLSTISVLMSDDKKIRVFSWNLPKSNGTYQHFGVVQAYSKRNRSYVVNALEDHSDEIEDPENEILTAKEWYGAHYYDLIQTKDRKKKRKYYTLLGWDGNNPLTTKKVIDVITLYKSGKPKFGAYLFRIKRKTYKRIIFEYSADVSVSLKFDQQLLDRDRTQKKKGRIIKNISFFERTLHKKKSKRDLKRRNRILSRQNKKISNKKRTRPKKAPGTEQKIQSNKKLTEMIVFDRLIPMSNSLEGIPRYYFPAGNVFDAFVFHKGKWIYVEDIDARNYENSSEDDFTRKKPNLELFPDKSKKDMK